MSSDDLGICSYSLWPLQSISQVIMTTDDRSKESHGKLTNNAGEMCQGFPLQNFPGNGKVLAGKCRKPMNAGALHFELPT